MNPANKIERLVTDLGMLVRLGAIGAVVLSVAAAFGYAGGWLSPNRLTQDRLMAAFQDANGTHAGFRRNHAKGVCVTGWFESSGQAAALSKAAVFKPGRVPLVGGSRSLAACPFRRMRLQRCAAWRCASCQAAAKNGARA
jgi:catalase